MEILWLALAALVVVTSMAGIMARKGRSPLPVLFYVALFLFFALAAFSISKTTPCAAPVMLLPVSLIALILVKGRSLSRGCGGKNAQCAASRQDTKKDGDDPK